MGYSKEHPEFNTADITLAIISIGTGNDWGRLYNIPLEYEQAVDVIAANCTTPQDVAEVNTDNCTSYMINIGGMGFDADVCHYVNRAKYSKHRVLGGSLLYLWSLIKAFVTGKGHHFTIKIDGKEFFNAQAFSVALGIGKYSGGGLIQTPDALPNDGLLDITVIHKANKLKVLTCLTKLFNSTIYQADIVSHAQGAEIDIYSDAKVEVDGENIGDGHIKLRVIPSAIKVAIPR
jgi:YegS/Rv2252/BmrU family lipid kinase